MASRMSADTSPSAFTAFVRRQHGAETPDADLLHEAWNALQAALGAELKRRGLWRSPPSYVGVFGHDRWEAAETAGDPMSHAWCRTRPTQSALEELVADCWAYVFSARMRSLKSQLQEKENIDGLVLRNVKNFLFERQREHDPIGFRIFERVQGAMLDAVSRRALYVLGGDARIRNNTVLGFAPSQDLRLPAHDLGPTAMRWNDELLPGLVTARGREERGVLARLDRLLLELPGDGVLCFRFRDLLDPLKHDARRRWAELLAREGASGTVEQTPDRIGVQRQALPDSAVESRQSLERLARCVSAAIDRAALERRARGYLASLWSYLVQHHGGVPAEGLAEAQSAEDEETEDGLPSHRQLSQRLQIPRERLPALFAELRRLVAACQAAQRHGGRPL
jgi:hypothetical protein